MSAVLSTPAGAAYISSSWPWSTSTSRNMTFWNDLLATLAQFSLFSSSTSSTTLPAIATTATTNTTLSSSTISTTTTIITTTASTTTTAAAAETTTTILSSTQPPPIIITAATITETLQTTSSTTTATTTKLSATEINDIFEKSFHEQIQRLDLFPDSNFNDSWSDIPTSELFNGTESDIKMFNIKANINETNNVTVDSVFNSLVDCSDFTEAKLLNLWNCTLNGVNNNVNNGVNNSPNSNDYFSLENSKFNDTIWNISDDIIRLYYHNNSHFNNGTDDTAGNTTGNKSSNFESTVYFIQVITTAVVLGIIILTTVIGNVFVIAAILLERNLQSVANYLILSLAVADLLVACLVMPLSAVYEISQEWKLGPELCDMWTSSDVLCCTASILHLVAIALDRYWAVTDIDYTHQRTAKRIGYMILILWILSFLVSIAPMLGWKDPDWDSRLENYQCLVSQDISYQIFATASSFYVPLLVILFLYWRIFLTARKRIRRRQQAVQTREPLANASNNSNIPLTTTLGFRWKVTYQQNQPGAGGCVATAAGGSGGIAAAVVAVIGRPLPTISEATTTTTTTAFTNVSSTNTSPEKCSYGNGLDDRIDIDPPTADMSVAYPSTVSCPPYPSASKTKKHKYGKAIDGKFKPSILKKRTTPQNDTNSKRERKAAKTLAIITGAFVCCWLPFFIIAIMLPLCPQCDISPVIISLCLWLGYFNSTLNPIIYTIFSPEFRNAFKRILCGRQHNIRRKNRRLGLRHTR